MMNGDMSFYSMVDQYNDDRIIFGKPSLSDIESCLLTELLSSCLVDTMRVYSEKDVIQKAPNKMQQEFVNRMFVAEVHSKINKIQDLLCSEEVLNANQ